MKYLTFILICLFPVLSIAQSELTGAAVDITFLDAKVEVQQQLHLTIPDSIQEITLRALTFSGTDLQLKGVSSAGIALDFNQNPSKGLHLVTITSKEQVFKTLDLFYTIIPAKAHFYLPLFFTNFPATNSDNDFFKASLKLPKNQNFEIHFPKVEMTQSETEMELLISLEVPALPSLFRLELLPKNATGMPFATMVDWFIAFIFIVIGIIIWKKRNQLRYG